MDDQQWFALAKDQDDEELLEALVESPPPAGPYHPLDVMHPLHQDVMDHPDKYVAVPTSIWNNTVALAAYGYAEKVKHAAMGELAPTAKPGEKKYVCRYDCGEAFTNSSNRNRHERKQHGKESGHES
jgi:hypothetical protein